MEVKFNQLDRGFKKYQNDYEKIVMSVLESGWYILGEQVRLFENNFKNYIGSKYCVGLNSGLDALILALRILNIGEGDEVIVPANTYIATVLAITENKATPVFVEPDEYYNINADEITKSITNKTKAILVVHLYGQAANMDKICKIANDNKLFIVEDCAQSHGATYNNRKTGTFGEIGCFSFYPTKNIGAFGDAGAIVTNDFNLYNKMKMIRNYGSLTKYYNEIQGVNSRLDEIQAAILNFKLSHYKEYLCERKEIVDYYSKNIKNNYINLPLVRRNATSVFHLFVVQTEYRNELQNYLKARDIETQIHYPIPPHLSKAYENLNYSINSFPITEKLSNTILSLPLYEGMVLDEAKYVVDCLNMFKKDE